MKNPSEIRVALAGAATTALAYRAADGSADAAVILGHGAGAGQHSPFMVDFARAIAARGVDAVTFNFPYTERKRRIPDRGPVLESCFRSVIAAVRDEIDGAKRGLFIGGKSMGGRIATQLAAAEPTLAIDGLVLLGYPLHPPGRAAQRRDKHLPAIARPVLFIQGTRDAFGTPAELAPAIASMNPAPALYVVSGGDHSFKLPRTDPEAQAAVYTGIQTRMVEWMVSVARTHS